MIEAGVIGWIACGLLAHGKWFAYVQDEYPMLSERDYHRDLFFSFALGMFGGPFSMVVTCIVSRMKHGWRMF